MSEKMCSLCGHEMSFDDFTRAWVCPVCGNSISESRESVAEFVSESISTPVSKPIIDPVIPPDVESEPINELKASEEKDVPAEPIVPTQPIITKEERLARAKESLRSRGFEKAMEDLSELRKKRFFFPQTYILMMLCGYHAGSTAELLNMFSKNVPALCKIAERSDWGELVSSLPREQRKYVAFVIEYCAIEIVLSGNAKMVLQRASGQSRERVSAFARMDEEDVHNMERTESLKKAREAQNGQTIAERAFAMAEEMADSPYDVFVDFNGSEWVQESDAWKYTKADPADSEVVSKLAGVSGNDGKSRANASFYMLVATKQKVKREGLEDRKRELLGEISSVESQILG
ncbi:MAG: hypothetical protein IK020_05895 [Clostridiales bacterium]|nr:hypothetical protein [Clostridiales bacterium]